MYTLERFGMKGLGWIGESVIAYIKKTYFLLGIPIFDYYFINFVVTDLLFGLTKIENV